jgi:hypothetical protein
MKDFIATLWIAIRLWWLYRQERIPPGYEEGEWAE